jgi:hypothetical protein
MFNWAVVGRRDVVSGKLCEADGGVFIAGFLEACLDNGLFDTPRARLP